MPYSKRTQKYFLYATLAIVSVVLGIWLVINIGKPKISEKNKTVKAQQTVETKLKLLARNIDGVLVEQGSEALPLVAVMIENHVDARPQSGLAKAPLVIEAPVEGGITRFLAFYDTTENLEKIGPIRSARPYYINWVRGYDAVYYHVGGSPDALKIIKKGGIVSLNQYFNSQYYWRTRKRYAPHDVYTSSILLRKSLDDIGDTKQENLFDSWKYTDEILPEAVSRITINFSTPSFFVEYRYDKEQNQYLRYMAGKVHKDEDGALIKVKNFVVIQTNIRILDKVGRRFIKTVGNGEALVFSGGQIIKGRWQKKTKNKRIKFIDASGEDVLFHRGNTWLEVVSSLKQVSFKDN